MRVMAPHSSSFSALTQTHASLPLKPAGRSSSARGLSESPRSWIAQQPGASRLGGKPRPDSPAPAGHSSSAGLRWLPGRSAAWVLTAGGKDAHQREGHGSVLDLRMVVLLVPGVVLLSPPVVRRRVSPARRSGISRVSARLTASGARSTVGAWVSPCSARSRSTARRNGLSPRDRVVLSALVVRAGDPISTEALADALWGDDLPASWAKVVHGCVARLRKRLGAAAIESGPSGYRLTLNETELDHRRFERLLRAGPGGAGRRRPGAVVVPGAGGAGPVARAGAGGPGGVGAGAGGGGAARGTADGRRGAARGGRDPRRPRARRAGAGAGAGRPGAVPGAALGAARHRAAPGRAAGRGPGRAQAGARDAGRRARPGPRPRAGGARAAAAAAGPVAGPGRGARGQRRLPLPRAAALRRRGRRLVLRPGGRRRGVPAAAAGLGRPGGRRAVRHRQVLAGPRRRGRVAGPQRDAGPGDHAGRATRWTRWPG